MGRRIVVSAEAVFIEDVVIEDVVRASAPEKIATRRYSLAAIIVSYS